MFDTMLSENVYAQIVNGVHDIEKFLNAIYTDNEDDVDYMALPYVNNPDEMPSIFPCLLGIFWHEDKVEASVIFAMDLADTTNITYHLCKAGAKLSDVQ